ncbi:VacJ family lipoprotein [Rhodocista pekingensis]|uniref:VacJ family lipoprotein n=1 Tax=Rhodocista pekingensis TaxID=201185 RepID=A0ABW2KZ65_9PROT
MPPCASLGALARPLLLLLLLGGCAGTADPGGYAPPQRQLPDLYDRPAQVRDPLYVPDPLETTNRRLYRFNARLDEYVLVPVVDAYVAVTPGFVRKRVSSFFLNLGEVNTFLNSVLQLRASKAGPTLVRFAVNSTLGLLGLFDVASEMGIRRESEDFGQTLGYWGVEPGAYLVLPALGPSNVRDAVGRVLDWASFSYIVPDRIDGHTSYKVARYGLEPIDTRYRVPFRYYDTGSPFEYELVRYALTEARALEIRR